jgi:hypothetical protein
MFAAGGRAVCAAKARLVQRIDAQFEAAKDHRAYLNMGLWWHWKRECAGALAH